MKTPLHDPRDLSGNSAAGYHSDMQAAAYAGNDLSTHRQLPAVVQRLLCGSPDVIALYPSPAEAEAALIDELAQTGHSIVQIAELLSTYPAAGVFAQHKARQPAAALGWLLDRVDRAQRHISGRHTIGDGLAAHLRAWAATVAQSTRPEQTDVGVLQAHIKTAVAEQALTYVAQRATLAQFARVSTVTVCHTNYRLVARGLIEVVEPGRARKPVLYRLLAPMPGMDSIGLSPRRGAAPRSVDDLFRSCGLGHAARMLYATLRWRPGRQCELAQRLKLNPAAVYYGLGPLVALGSHASGQLKALAYDHGGVWYARPADLAEVAEVLFGGRWRVCT